jgi:hypothetical protein
MRSTVPNRISAMMPKPTNKLPNMPSWMSRPGTKICHGLPGGKFPPWTSLSSSGANSAR